MLFPRGRLRRAVLHEVRPYIGERLWRAFAADNADVFADITTRHHRLAADDDDGVYGTIINLPFASVVNI